MAVHRFLKRWCRTLSLMVVVVLCFGLWQTVSDRQKLAQLRIPEQYSLDLPRCSAVIMEEIPDNKADLEKLLSSRRREHLPETFYINATKDCRSYTENREFIKIPLSLEEEEFPIAYSMVIHEKIEMFERLLRAVYAPQNIYCVHVDQKSSEDFKKAVRGIVSCFPNVFVASKLESVVYASWYRVQADLNCMKDLMDSHVQWKYLLNTCGTDFPIKTNRQMVQAMKSLNGRNSMESTVPPDYKKPRWEYHFITNKTIMRTNEKKSPPPINTPISCGSAYFVVTRDFVRHVLEDKGVEKFLEWGKDTYSPDEYLWATLQRMPSVPGSLPANKMFDVYDVTAIARAVKWYAFTGNMKDRALYPPCRGIIRREVCVYGLGDITWLMKQQHLLANKFDSEVDDVVIRCLESVLYFKALTDSQKTLPFHF
ncbi:beta-1,3-galactosyl-O-glycosyl-glycoprotein beta-1,6-N-acetylglucosaminyltransferase 3-like [Thalassophryne amazonica]|uniref:beta-1,3-galactosyl-O-glycosyl-glycoprotein beta-1,6-N-acetylglucosaminyltransferase 3-like n=1 Tax=Thalassophryne amazonica TaxID=390379 RepID=UPI001470C97C|nr:beta-1,3-galactosyl-O-glycosyl-glycoprotein beta-1,6-N-acetylglucosaminyltransferase 3-like [Thalassophryne amazonica]